MRKIYISPSAKRGTGYTNPYVMNMKKSLGRYFEVLEADNRPCLMQGLALLRNSLRADVFVLNFLESIGFQKFGFVQFCMAHLALRLLRLRGGKLVYVFHNRHPHQGENFMTRSLTKTLLKHSTAVFSHSGAASEYARKLLGGMGLADAKVHDVCHPVKMIPVKPDSAAGTPCDVFLWGAVLPYKGIFEFVRDPALAASGLSVRIIGSCGDTALAEAIRRHCNERVVFENRRAGFDEIAWYCRQARCVLFPYLPDSISSSGALIDTIVLGGIPLGPDVGAFSDLARAGVCRVYADREEMFRLLAGEEPLAPVDEGRRRAFIAGNSWESFASKIASSVTG